MKSHTEGNLVGSKLAVNDWKISGAVQLGWIPPAGAVLAEAEELVKESDVAVVFVGLSSELEGKEMQGESLYSFGFGLSYSRFEYSRLKAKRTPTGATIQATVKNASARDGNEVVQLYVGGGGQPLAGIPHVQGTL